MMTRRGSIMARRGSGKTDGMGCSIIKSAIVLVGALIAAVMGIAVSAAASPSQAYAATEYLTVGSRIPYDNYNTTWMWVDGAIAYCADPGRQTPPEGAYTRYDDLLHGAESANRDQWDCWDADRMYLRDVLYHSYGAPGFDSSLYPSRWYDGSSMTAERYVACTHFLISDMYKYNIEDATYGCSAGFCEWVGRNVTGYWNGVQVPNYANTFRGKVYDWNWDAPDTFKAFMLETGPYQAIFSYDRAGWISIDKNTTAGYENCVDGNPNYTLAGAVYGIYSNSACTSEAGRLTTDADGKATSGDLLPGTYYVKEITAPKNYELDKTVYTVTVEGGQTTPVNGGTVSDTPSANSFPSIDKLDSDTKTNVPQGDALLAGAQFTVNFYYGTIAEQSGKTPVRSWVLEVDKNGVIAFDDAHKVSGDIFYRAGDGSIVLPIGSISWQETKAPEGYLINSEVQRFDVKQSIPLADITTSEHVKRGGFKIQKWDAELDRTEPQGDGSFAGVTFNVYNRSAKSVVVNGKEYQPGAVCFTFELPDNGYYASADDLLPYGTYEFKEVSGSDNGSYYVNEGWSKTEKIREDGQIADLTPTGNGPHDQVLRGGLAVQKFASEVSDDTVNLSSNGTFPDVRLQSALRLASVAAGTQSEEIVNAASFCPADSAAFIDMIMAAAEGTDALTADMLGMKNDENQTMASDPMATAQAGAMFKGAEVTVTNASKHSVNIEGRGVVEVGGVVAVLVLDENGYAATDSRALPYGTYTLTETKAPEGYHLNANWSKTVKIREEGVIVEVGDLPEAETGLSGVDDQVIRGDYAFVKNAADTQSTLPFTPFLLVNLQSGENHVIVTNENGEFYSQSYIDGSPYNLHSNNTNANDDAITWNEDGTYTIDDEKLDNFAGAWFTGYGPLNDPTGVLAQRVDPNDQLGALPYGDYALIELEADINSGYESVVRTFTISREGFTVNGGTITDDWIEIELQTTAHDAATGDNFGSIENDATTIVDVVEFGPGLRADEVYTFTGVLMDKSTNESVKDADGNEITASATHLVTADESANGGTVEVEFADIPSELLRGKTTVVFEDLYDANGTWVAAHADIDDEGQTVYYPDIHTTATDGITGDHQGNAPAGGTVTINDEVAYAGLKPGETYTMTGTLYDKATGEAIDGVEPVSVEFTPETSDGSVEVVFEVPADLLRGKDTVVFENCYLGEREVAVHADIEDEGQTVEYPEIHTTATDGNDGDKTFSGQQTVTLIDTVEYSNLTPGVEYTMVGTLYDKATGEPVPGIEPVSQAFTPESEDGTMEMAFTFDVVDLVGHDIVVFEDCYRDFDANGELADNERIAQHADINDAGQTVNVKDAGLADEEIVLSQTGSATGAICGAVAALSAAIALAALFVRRKQA